MFTLTASRIDVSGLIDRPGASRQVDLVLPAPDDLVLPGAEIAGEVTVRGILESLVDGILLRGEVSAGLAAECARCVRPLEHRVSAAVAELFADPTAVDDEVEDGYEIADGVIDLDLLVRDALAEVTPYRLLCREDCRGLCPRCGSDRNTQPCACVEDHHDERWAALRDLRLAAE